jgi:hypothetical protein
MRAQSAPYAGKFIAFRTELDVIQEFSWASNPKNISVSIF